MQTVLALQRRACESNPSSATGEAVLVARTRKGDHEAFEALVRQHKEKVLNVARRVVCDDDAAEDVAQEVFIKAYRQLHRFRGEASFSTWLYRIVINESRAYLRSERRRKARLENQAALEASQPEPREVSSSETGPMVALLTELPEKQRTTLALFYLQELSLEEIAKVLGAPTGTIKAWLSRGREKLRRLARDRGML